jgi:hypothetical protein
MVAVGEAIFGFFGLLRSGSELSDAGQGPPYREQRDGQHHARPVDWFASIRH